MQQFRLFVKPIESAQELENELNEWAAGQRLEVGGEVVHSEAPHLKRTQLAMTTDTREGGCAYVGVLVSYESKANKPVEAPPGANVTLEQWSEFVLAVLGIRRGRLNSIGARAEIRDHLFKHLPVAAARVHGVREAIGLALDDIAGSSLEKERVLMQGRDSIVAAVTRLLEQNKVPE